MSQETDLARKMLGQAIIYSDANKQQWVKVMAVDALGSGQKEFMVETPDPKTFKGVPEKEARFIKKHLGIQFRQKLKKVASDE